jgi:diguanylate cyclase (GGDEF)-like protein/PAS domain S-box-containing protein
MIDRCTGNTLLGASQQPRRMPAPARADARHAAAIDAAAVFRHAATAMVVTDDRMHILAANPAYGVLTGLAEFEVIGTPLPGARQGGDGGPWEAVLHHSGGQTRTVWMTQSTLRDRQGAVQWHVVTLADISRLDSERQALRHQAQHDALTQLPNRSLFNAEFERGLARARRHAQRLAVLFIDLDQFKWVNDSLGHDAGDAVLREVARRLRTTVRAEDLVARWGGDEFIVVLDDPIDSAAVAGAARLLQAAIARGIDTMGHRLRMSASIGVALFPDDAGSLVDLLRASDAAMYHAKQRGGARVELAGRP